jgi:dipeptidyl aminopeptidase/acylaminoacyl peptidase
MKINKILLLLALPVVSIGQSKKPLDHSVYDAWQSIGEKTISNDGRYVAYTVTPQEGDAKLYIKRTTGETIAEISRGYNVSITDDNKFVIYKIKPWYKETREARIKKKKPDEMPKDSLGILSLEDERRNKLYARVKTYKMPEDVPGWAAFLFEKPEEKKGRDTASKVTKADINDAATDYADEEAGGEKKEDGADLILKNLQTNEEKTFKNVVEFFFNKTGKKLLLEVSPSKKDSTQGNVQLYDLATGNSKVIFRRFNDAKGFAMDDEGTQMSFVAERDSLSKALQKFHKLWYYKNGMDSAEMIADRYTAGIKQGWAVSENSRIIFSKSGKRLLFGTAPIGIPKDTTVPEIDRVNVDVWNYKDDYLQPQQLKNRDNEEKRSFTAIYDWQNKRVVQLGGLATNPVYVTNEGDGEHFYATSDSGMRQASQWQGFTLKNVYHVNPVTGAATEIKRNFKGNVYPSYQGKYLLLYDEKQKQYSVYNPSTKTTTVISSKVPYPLYDEENDVPDDPNAYGVVQWMEDDKAVLVYDNYDIWKLDPENKTAPANLTTSAGRKQKLQYRFLNTDREERFIKPDQTLYLRAFNEVTKDSILAKLPLTVKAPPVTIISGNGNVRNILKSKYNDVLLFSQETFQRSPDLYTSLDASKGGAANFIKLSSLNPQQSNYSWGTSKLFKWTAYTGKLTEGVLYKPENFDPKKKYPMIVYFYERSNNTLNSYLAPSPTPSRLNIPFFVSRGYVVFVPDIWYKTGYPGKSAYDYIVSGTRALIKQGFVDSTKIGLQGQSWGGYQIAYLITRTNLYAAAWAGAPVANMTSAYGGIRWGTGINRQFQYEKTQSRIGATLWERPDLYIENSPLFQLPKVKTPVVIMANDADDAVPWYQGIEMFTALRRLNKPVWLLNYNGEAHNLVERKNRKDISIREQQFFDWLLKGEKPAQWLVGGVPALLKGKDMGLAIPSEN